MGDNIKKPDHYCEGREYEPKDVIRDWGLNFNLGSAVKYISRAGRKGDKLEDLRKAKQFLEFEIEVLEEEERMPREFFYKSIDALDECKARLSDKDKMEQEEKSDIGMTCKEAAEIGDAIAKGFEKGFKEAEEKHDESELDIYCRGFDAGYDWAHKDLRSVEDTFTISFKVEED